MVMPNGFGSRDAVHSFPKNSLDTKFLMRFSRLTLIISLLPIIIGCSNGEDSGVSMTTATAGQIVFSGGHETDPVDHGRPVALIGNALGVTPEVFRDAFSGVSPAENGSPSPSRAQANKQILMDKLGPLGVTNERLDEVSNFYRYRPQSGELWKHKPAVATATIKDSKVTGFKISDGGYGYSTPPTVQIAGHLTVKVKAELEYTSDLQTNGRVKTLTIIK